MKPLISEKRISFSFLKHGHMAILILIVALGMGALVETKELAKITNQLYEHPFKVINNLLEADRGIAEMRTLMGDIVLSRSDAELAALEDRLDFLESTTNAHFEDVADLFLGDKTDVLNTHQLFKEWKSLRRQIIRLVRAGRYDEALNLNRGESSAIVDQLANDMGSLIAFARSKAESFMRDSEERHYEGRIFLLVSLVAVILLTVIISVGTVNRDRESRKDLLESESRFRELYERTPVMLHSVDKQGRVFDVSDYWLERLGYCRQDVIGRPLGDFLSEESRRFFENEVDPKFQETGEIKDLELEFVRGDGALRMTRLSASAKYAADESFLFSQAVLEDITDRLKAEKAIEESEHRLSVAIDNMAVGIIAIKENGTITEFNPFAEKIFGYEAAEVVDKNVRMLIPEPHLSEPDQGLHIYLDTKSGESGGGDRDAKGLRKDGDIFPMRLRVGELEAVGGSLFVATIYDLTEIKRLEGQLRQSQKMDAIGQLTGGIAHDFNNIIGIVMGNLELLQSQVASDAKTLKSVNSALKGAERGASLTRKLLGISRKSAAEVKLTNVNDFIKSLHGLIAKSLTPSIRVDEHLAADLWPVEIDPGDFEDVLLNLSLNARDAMPDGGALVIETANTTLDEDHVKHNPEAGAVEFVTISVSDTGTGMTDEVREKIFEPFFTTKDQGKGTGLGLPMVYGFVQRSGGHLEIESELGKGTTFRISLPRAQGSVSGNEETIDIQDSVPTGSETVLIVDDEKDLADVAVTVLEGLGYKTFCANDGNQALKILNENEDIDLLFSDVIMPDGLDGYKLALAALEARPALKILLASGFTKAREEDVQGETATVAELAGKLLGKPYNRSELARAIRRTLDEEKKDEA
jgi:PAS domain S-box-containing protein